MSVTIEVSISENLDAEMPEAGDDDVPEPALLETWANAAYLKDTDAIASMMVTTADEIQQLNKQYRDKDSATNVLSFPMELPDEVDMCILGDIAKAEQFHWAHMVVHGMLHLQGFDHIENDEAEAMEALEISILEKLGFDNPYT